MFKVSTTIVLGAGASHSYGYPTGDTLVGDIITLCHERLNGDLLLATEEQRTLENLRESLSFYDPVSIDGFLTHYRDDQELVDEAKRAITHVLLRVNNRNLFRRGASLSNVKHRASPDPSHWYRYFWDAIVSEQSVEQLLDESNDLNFKVITFNYDNSLEFFLLGAIYSPNSMFSDDQKGVFWEKIRSKIIHVYGSLAGESLTVSSDGQIEPISFYDRKELELRKMAENRFANIYLIDERDNQDYETIRNAIRSSSQVIFLGFGFDDTNIGQRVLDLKNSLMARPANESSGHSYLPIVKYTNFGNSEKINRRLNRILYTKVNPDDSRWTQRKVGVGVFRSDKKVYQALGEDFQLNDI